MVSLTPDSAKQIRDLETELSHAQAIITEGLLGAVPIVTDLLKVAVREQFIAGRDKFGVSHNKTGKTLDTLQSHAAGLVGEIEMGGGAVFVQWGTKPHPIVARNAPFLQWYSEQYGWVRKRSVKHPGSRADDYAGRAIEHVEMTTPAKAVFDRLTYRLERV